MRIPVQLRQRWEPRWLMLEIRPGNWGTQEGLGMARTAVGHRVLVYGAIARASSREGVRWWEQPTNNPIVFGRTPVGISRPHVGRYGASEGI
jgi:hypothetical protein